MRLLYLSCHEALAYDEAIMLSELGIEVFVLGDHPGSNRPSLSETFLKHEHLLKNEMESAGRLLKETGCLTREFIDRFDVVYFVARNDWIIDNWEVVKHKRVIFRLIGQSDDGTEIRLRPFVEKGMIVLGYSPFENRRFKFFPIKHTVRFYKDPGEWGNWNGGNASVMTSCRFIDRDGECCNPSAYRRVVEGFPSVLYGPGNQTFLGPGTPARCPDYEEFKKAFRDHRVYFYVGTRPATYTLNFIEAWMTGMPVVSLGPGFNTYEVCELIDDGVNGIFSDDLGSLRSSLKVFLSEPSRAAAVGREGRLKAIQLFGKENVKKEWQSFLRSAV